ncbi:MAG: phosphatase PAP2 family protein [Bacteroidota bacterium]
MTHLTYLTSFPSCTFACMYLAASSFWQTLLKWDQALFKKINSDWANPLFDTVMPFLRTSLNWAPLYLFVLVLVLHNFKLKGLWWALFFLVTVSLTDMTGTYVFKHNILRLRPCRDPEFFQQVRLLLENCSGGSSFTSNHAANHFGMAAFFFISFRHIIGKWAWLGLIWAASIAYAQVYVGVHYPLDVLAGALLGLTFGCITGHLFNKRFGFAIFGNQPTGLP